MMKYEVLIRRIAAAVIDWAILSVPSLLLYGFEILTKKKYNVSFYFIFIYLWYFIQFNYKYGQTVGKKIAKIKVVSYRNENSNITLKQAFMRETYLIIFVFLYLGLFIFGKYLNTAQGGITKFLQVYAAIYAIVMLLSDKNRSLHDFFANSIVIKAETRNDS